MGFPLSSEINFDDARVVLDAFDGAFAQHGSLVHDRDRLGNLPDKFHVMLNDDNGMLVGQRLKQVAGFLGFLIGHSRDRLINEEEFRILQENHADFQPLFFSV